MFHLGVTVLRAQVKQVMDHSAPATVKVTHLAMQNTLLKVEKNITI